MSTITRVRADRTRIDTNRRAPNRRAPSPRHALFGPRAVVGGLLVAVAMVGTFAAYSSADDTPADRVLVVRPDVRAGEPLAAGDVSEAPADLPEVDPGRGCSTPTPSLTGAIALAPLRSGDLLQRSAVLPPGRSRPRRPTPRREFSLPVERDRALNGDIARGETVDVLATYGTGESAYTVTVARRAHVVDVAETTGGLGSDGRIVVVVALDDAEDGVAGDPRQRGCRGHPGARDAEHSGRAAPIGTRRCRLDSAPR